MPRGVYDRSRMGQRSTSSGVNPRPNPSEFADAAGMEPIPGAFNPRDMPMPDPDLDDELEQKSAFVREKEENPESLHRRQRARFDCPWTEWLCLDSDGKETSCGAYTWGGQIGGFPVCPKCGSKVALPKDAHELNQQNLLTRF